MDEPMVIKGADAPVAATPTPGMTRREALATEGAWMGLVTTAPRTESGWHHHGDHTSYLYLAGGRARLEFGPGGRDVLEAGPGDFAVVPPHVVHRESNPGDDESAIVVLRIGHGPPVVNVEGPDEG